MSTDNASHEGLFLDPKKILLDMDLTEGMYIADFGAGSGYMSFQAAEMVGPRGRVYALDVQKPVIEHINQEIKARHLANIKVIWTDLEMVGRNPIPASSIDLVLLVNTIFQSTKKNEMLKEVVRQLKPTGRLLVVDWKKTSAPFGPRVDERVDLEKFKELAYNLGLNKIQEFDAGPYHFGLVFRK